MKRKDKVIAKKFFLSWKGKLIILFYSILFFVSIINYGIAKDTNDSPYFPADTLIGFLLLIVLFVSLVFIIIKIVLEKGSEKAKRYFPPTSVP